MPRMNVRYYFSALFGALLATLTFASANAQQGPIRVGEINSYTGPLAAFTVPYRNGWQLAIEEINAKGGVLGRPLEVISRDDGGKPANAIKFAEELLRRENVDLLAGTFLSNIGLAVADFANRNKTLFVASEPLSDAVVWSNGNRLHVPAPPLHLHAGRHAGRGSRQASRQALGDGRAQLRVRAVRREGLSRTSSSSTASGCGVRGGPVARALQAGCRCHRAGPRPSPSPMRSSMSPSPSIWRSSSARASCAACSRTARLPAC